ncbi:CACTA en-spm transposon protein [Cucumis melo var. makuwa]|uniref:CACTA en-spm transposon protein n=1 Tax=Cucumis melo var. makuwa TaxID=1194695 RepID=A0A5A7TV56_CUCMM|nr:CACTA en-spm transposon protein [Cucumis melo var. makuwa]TYK23608.1 CACTA en-spm transposon protein [Cucumis melo var. makuwa]
MCVVSTLGVGAPHCNKWAHSDDDRPWSGEAYFPIRRSLQPGDRRRFFVLDLNDQAMNRFVEHQMLTTFKEFQADCHKHFKKYSGPEEAHANPPNALVGRHED